MFEVYHCVVTVKLVALVAIPPCVVIPNFPVSVPEGKVAVTCVSESTVKVVAFTLNEFLYSKQREREIGQAHQATFVGGELTSLGESSGE
jgi:hypothetical protein